MVVMILYSQLNIGVIVKDVRVLGWGLLFLWSSIVKYSWKILTWAHTRTQTHTHTDRKMLSQIALFPCSPFCLSWLNSCQGRRAAAGREGGRDAAGVQQSAGASSIAGRQGAALVSGWGARALNRQLYSHCELVFYLHFFTEPLNLRLKPLWMGIIRFEYL